MRVAAKALLQDNGIDLLTEGLISSYLPEGRAGSLIVLDSVDSTNNYLKGLAAEGALSGTAVIADSQTSGKGRLGRSFLSPSGVGIYLSYLFRPESGFENISNLTGWVSVAVADALKSACGIEPQLKWVNDLLINRKKICGILTEGFASKGSDHIDNCIIGIGINVNETQFPEELSAIASSIAMENNGQLFDRSVISAELIKALDALSMEWPSSPYYLNRYRELSITVGSDIAVFPRMLENGQERTGKALAINEDFSLKVRFEDGTTEDVRSGEVSVRGLYGYT